MNLEPVFNPRNVAIIGASKTPGKVGYNCLKSVVDGGFKGEIYPIHLRHDRILGLKVYKSILDVDSEIDLAIVALNQYLTVETIEDCAIKGVKGIISIASGFREVGKDGEILEKKLAEKAKKYDIALIGPNTMGIINTYADLYATFTPLKVKKGSVSIITQSGGVGLNILFKLIEEKVGISKWIGVGNRAVIDFHDVLKYLKKDSYTKVIGIFMEGTEKIREFLDVGKEVVREKPILIYKIGKRKEVDFHARTHTGSSIGDPKLYSSAFKQFGMIQVESVREMVAKCKALSYLPMPSGNSLGMVTYSAGPSLIAMDKVSHICKFPSFERPTIEKIENKMGGAKSVVIKNPLDTINFGFLPEDFGEFARFVLEDPNVDILLAICVYNPGWRFPTSEIIELKKKSSKPIVVCYPAEHKIIEKDMERFAINSIPLYSTPEEAAWGIEAILEYGEIKQKLQEKGL